MQRNGFVHTNGIRMHYVEEGSGPLVLLCHGWPETSYSWRHQIPALAAAGYRVVAPDQRGYGLTDAPPRIEDYTLARLTGDLVGLVRALGEERAVIVGHDWGSIVAANAALHRPDMFHALGLLSVPYVPRPAIRPATRYEQMTQERHFYQEYFQKPDRVERELEGDVRRTILGILYSASAVRLAERPTDPRSFVSFAKNERLIDNVIVPDELPSWLTEHDLKVYTEQFEHSGFRGGINWYRNMDLNWERAPYLDGCKIQQPTVFVAGEHDGILAMLAAEVAALETNVPRLTKKVLVPGAGHWVQQEQPEATTAALIEFLNQTAQPTG